MATCIEKLVDDIAVFFQATPIPSLEQLNDVARKLLEVDDVYQVDKAPYTTLADESETRVVIFYPVDGSQDQVHYNIDVAHILEDGSAGLDGFHEWQE